MERARASRALGAAGIALLLLAAPAAAQTVDQENERATLRSREVLAHIDEAPPIRRDGWLARHVALSLAAGLQYSQGLRVGSRDVQLIVHGPVLKVMQRRQLGLRLELRF